MDSYTWALIAVAVVAVLCMIWAFSRGRHPCPTALFTGLAGICVLLLLNVLSPFIGPTQGPRGRKKAFGPTGPNASVCRKSPAKAGLFRMYKI